MRKIQETLGNIIGISIFLNLERYSVSDSFLQDARTRYKWLGTYATHLPLILSRNLLSFDSSAGPVTAVAEVGHLLSSDLKKKKRWEFHSHLCSVFSCICYWGCIYTGFVLLPRELRRGVAAQRLVNNSFIPKATRSLKINGIASKILGLKIIKIFK